MTRHLTVSRELLEDHGFDLGRMLLEELEASPNSSIRLTLMGFNGRLGPVPEFLADPRPQNREE